MENNFAQDVYDKSGFNLERFSDMHYTYYFNNDIKLIVIYLNNSLCFKLIGTQNNHFNKNFLNNLGYYPNKNFDDHNHEECVNLTINEIKFLEYKFRNNSDCLRI